MTSSPQQKKTIYDFIFLLLIFLLFPLVYCIVFERTPSLFHYPFSYGEDGVLSLSIIKGIIQNGWYLENKYLGAPFVQMHYDYPIPEGFFVLLIKVIGWLNPNHFEVLNIFFLLSYSLTGISSYLVLRKLGVSIPLSLSGSFAFTFLPYHQLRLNHLFLANYFSVPIFVYISYLCFSQQESSFKKKIWLILLLLLAIATSSGIYYAFFGALFILLSGALAYFINNDRKGLKKSFLFAGFILIVTLVNIAPNLAWQATQGSNPAVGKRHFLESELYALKLVQLVIPTHSHRLPFFAKINEKYSFNAPLVNENATATLGIIGSIGLLILLLYALFKNKISDSRLFLASQLNLFAILFASVGGGGMIFAIAVTAQFRGLTRISVFIAFLAILSFCLVIEKLFDQLKHSQRKKMIFKSMFAGFMIIFAFWDEISPQHVPGVIFGYEMFDSNESYFKEIESSLPKNAMIYQLPYIPYPESAVLNNEGFYGLFRPYLHTQDIRWSYGAMRSTKEDTWLLALSKLNIGQQIFILKQYGFSGILIDRRAYIDRGNQLEKNFLKLSKTPPKISPDGHFVFFNTNDFIYAEKYKPADNELVFPYFKSQWGAQETDTKSRWAWSIQKKSELIFQTFSKDTIECHVQFKFQGSGPSIVHMNIQNAEKLNQTFDFNKVNTYDVSLNLKIPPSGILLTFNSNSKPISLDAKDSRKFSYRIIDLKMCAKLQ